MQKKMYIKKLNIISFGGIQNKTVLFSDGLNVIFGSNEVGKSTVMAFIKYVFYGISGRKNEFKHYLPLSGEPMCGSITVCDCGTEYEIYRTSKGAKAKQVSVINKTSGNAENAETAQNIGKKLFMLGEEAFLNTLFVTSISNKISGGDGEIFSRLSNLAETGDENISYEKISEKIENDILNLSSPRRKNAVIPTLESELSNLAERRERALDNENRAKKIGGKIFETKAALNKKEDEKIRLEEAKLNSRIISDSEKLKEYEREISAAENELNKTEYELSSIDINRFEKIKNVSASDEKIFLEGFGNENEARLLILEERLKNAKSKKKLSFIGIFSAAVLAVFFAFTTPLLCALPIILAAVCIYVLISARAEEKNTETEKENTIAEKEEKAAFISNFQKQTNIFSREEYLALKNKYSAAAAKKEILASKCEMLRSSLLKKREEFEKEKRKTLDFSGFSDTNELYEKSKTVFSDISHTEAERKLKLLDDEISQLKILLANSEFEINSLKNSSENLISIEEQIENIKSLLNEKKEELAVITEAKKILEEASGEQRNNFAPGLAKKTGEIFSLLTNGKHSEILIDKAFNTRFLLDGKYTDEVYLSKGTLDQLYFSLRFGIIETISEKNVPIFLDDAFNQYDDFRLKTVLSYLCDCAKNTQILITACRKDIFNRLSENVNIINL